MTEHPELRKGRRRLFIPIKDNNTGKELSAATISRWICTTIVDSHATLQNSIVSQERSKLIRSMQWLLHYKSLTSRPIGSDKAGRWSSRGTLTSSCLRDLCPQADSIHKTGLVIAAGEILIYLLTHGSSWSLSLF